MQAANRKVQVVEKFGRYFVVLLVVLSCFAGIVFGQSTASLSGTVTDASGATVPNARVLVINQGTGIASSSQTDAAGAYLFPSLPIGTYRVEVSASSFQTAVIGNLKLEVATATTQNFQLKVGETTQRLEIVADAAVVETTTNSLGQVINDKTVQEIPLNGRHFTDLSLLTTGTAMHGCSLASTLAVPYGARTTAPAPNARRPMTDRREIGSPHATGSKLAECAQSARSRPCLRKSAADSGY